MTIKNSHKFQYYINGYRIFIQRLRQRANLQLFPIQEFFVQNQFPGIYFASCMSEILLTDSKRLMDLNSWNIVLTQGDRLIVLWKDEFFGMTSA